MATHTVRLTAKPLTRIQRIWYWRLHIEPPLSTSGLPGHANIVRLLPAGWAGIHRRYATRRGYYWLPCVLCDRPFGGHQSAGNVPDPLQENTYVGICPRCTRAGRSVD